MSEVPAVPAPAPAPTKATESPVYMATFMPWAGVGIDELKIGPVTIWDYGRFADDKIQDPMIREQLDKVLACYVGKDGEPARSAAILTHGAADFRALNDEEKEAVQRAADALAFSVIYSNLVDLVKFNIWTDAAPSSDRYQFYLQNFTLGAKYVKVRAGVSTDIWPLADLRFSQPWALGGSRSRPDAHLVAALGRVIDPVFPEDDRRRIFRSLEWFRMAHTQNDMVHPLSKATMMSTAFETLLQVGDEDKKAQFFRACIEAKTNYTDALTDTFPEWKNVKGQPAVQVPVTFTKAAWWAKNFYDLRSNITHGDYIDPERLRFTLPGGKKKMSQLDVAALLFGEMLIWELEEKKVCGSKVDDFLVGIRSLSDKGEHYPLQWKDWAAGVRAQRDLGDVHRRLGWVKPRAGDKLFDIDEEDDEDEL